MKRKVKDFLADRTQSLAETARMMREAPVAAARGAANRSAGRLKSMSKPVREVARSGVKLTEISQAMLKDLIELQANIVTTALDDAAQQLEGAARTENVMDVVRNQADVLRSTRERIVADMTHAMGILTEAGKGARDVATETYAKVRSPAAAVSPVKFKRAARKPSAKKGSKARAATKARAGARVTKKAKSKR